MIEATKIIARKNKSNTALDTADTNERKTKKLRKFCLIYFHSLRYIGDDGSQDYIIFQQIYYTFPIPTGDNETRIA